MKIKTANPVLLMVLGILWIAPDAWAHVSANVKLLSSKETIQRLLPQGKLFVKEVDLTPGQLEKLRSFDNWDTRASHFKFFVSRDQQGRLRRVMISMVEFTRHGPVVVAVAIDPQGKITGAILTDTQVEPLIWLEPLLKKNFMQAFQGMNSQMPLTLDPQWQQGLSRSSQEFALVIVSAVKEAAQWLDVVFEPGNGRSSIGVSGLGRCYKRQKIFRPS